MAFLQPIEIQETGVCAQYWRLTHVQLDIAASIVEAKIHGYLDEAARRAGKSPLSVMSFRLRSEGLVKDNALALSDIYNAVRASAQGGDGSGGALPPLFRAAKDI
ncbi:MAG: hypothetical protein EBX37_05865 [Alphaproteobacteria bacterium]|nr:hypothetical protein [Alphaproteobacteria bacterium]